MKIENTGTLAQAARLTVKPSKIVNAARGPIGHAIMWALIAAQAEALKIAARGAK